MAATPLHFGDSDRKLYGVFHHPEQRAANAPAVLLLNPFGEEAIRSFRIFKQLAERLARAGRPVLRFDYYGTGDSEGDCETVDFDGMIRDAATAQEELEALSGARRFVWVGLGLGGAVALRAAIETAARPTQLFLWDPVLSGADYLAGLRRAHIATLSAALDLPQSRIEREIPEEISEALGFCLPDRFCAQLKVFDFVESRKVAREIRLIGSEDTVISARHEDALKNAAAEFRQYDSGSTVWNSNEAMNAYTIPMDVLDCIAGSAGGRS